MVHTGNHQACNDDVSNIWEIFVSLMSTDSLISHVFSSPTFSYTLIWFVETYVKGFTPRLFLERVTMKVVRNTVKDVKFTFTMKGYSVLVVVCHSGPFPTSKRIKKGEGNYN